MHTIVGRFCETPVRFLVSDTDPLQHQQRGCSRVPVGRVGLSQSEAAREERVAVKITTVDASLRDYPLAMAKATRRRRATWEARPEWCPERLATCHFWRPGALSLALGKSFFDFRALR